jgi:hypothetical protein
MTSIRIYIRYNIAIIILEEFLTGVYVSLRNIVVQMIENRETNRRKDSNRLGLHTHNKHIHRIFKNNGLLS